MKKSIIPILCVLLTLIVYSACSKNPSDKVSAVVISPAAGNFIDSVEVSLTCATSGAKIYYTTDGSEPGESSTAYSAPFKVTSSLTVKARAYLDGMGPSEVTGSAYIINKSIVLDFDDAALFPTEGMEISDQYKEYALFTSDTSGSSLTMSSYLVHEGNALWSTDDLIVDFTKTVYGLKFYVISMDTEQDSKTGDINIYQGSTMVDTYVLMGEGSPTVPYLVDLSGYGDIDKIEILETDYNGLTYDTFTFAVKN